MHTFLTLGSVHFTTSVKVIRMHCAALTVCNAGQENAWSAYHNFIKGLNIDMVAVQKIKLAAKADGSQKSEPPHKLVI